MLNVEKLCAVELSEVAEIDWFNIWNLLIYNIIKQKKQKIVVNLNLQYLT